MQGRRNSSLAELTGFYQSESSEPKSHALEGPFTVASLADLALAELDLSTYRIPDSGMEGCFNDINNGSLATLYLQFTDSAVC